MHGAHPIRDSGKTPEQTVFNPVIFSLHQEVCVFPVSRAWTDRDPHAAGYLKVLEGYAPHA